MEPNDLIFENEIEDKSLFMMCKTLNHQALTELPEGFYVRTCRKDELDIWKSMPFEDEEEKEQYQDFMTAFFNEVYAEQKELFFEKCLFVCDHNDMPIGTCFAWKAYNEITTIHWFKVKKGMKD